jgi:hypothetical protein
MNSSSQNRGPILSIWLALMLFWNIGGVFMYILDNFIIPTNQLLFTYGIFGLANIIFTIYLIRWKKWALYGIFLTAFFAFIVSLMIQQTLLLAVSNIAFPFITYGIMKFRWKMFE